MSSISERVQAGVTLLDTFGPADWRKRIDLRRFEITSAYDCILGQLYSTYARGLDALNVPWQDGPLYGFISAEGTREWHALQYEWERVLQEPQS